jgi:hypothetical protein
MNNFRTYIRPKCGTRLKIFYVGHIVISRMWETEKYDVYKLSNGVKFISNIITNDDVEGKPKHTVGPVSWLGTTTLLQTKYTWRVYEGFITFWGTTICYVAQKILQYRFQFTLRLLRNTAGRSHGSERLNRYNIASFKFLEILTMYKLADYM